MTTDRRRRGPRRIAVVTGTRAEYGLLRSAMEAIRARRDLHLQLVVTGMHLLKKFGHTVDEIVSDGWSVDARVKMQAGNDEPLDYAIALSRGVAGAARFFVKAKTDIVLVLGDRIEAMAGGLAAVTTGKLVAHIHGGDLAQGDLDDSVRHAITKLAHVHLTATRASSRRVIRMGEPADRVHLVGAPGLDRLKELTKHVAGAAGGAQRAIIVQHPRGRSAATEGRLMKMILRAVAEAACAPTLIYPNSDRGHTGIVREIENHRRAASNGSVRVFRSLDRDTYLRLLIDANVLVGNSSSGIIEAATAGTPAVNIGPRQAGRQRSGTAVIEADESISSIREAMAKALRQRPIRGAGTTYGDGTAGTRIASVLARMPISDEFRRKKNAY